MAGEYAGKLRLEPDAASRWIRRDASHARRHTPEARTTETVLGVTGPRTQTPITPPSIRVITIVADRGRPRGP